MQVVERDGLVDGCRVRRQLAEHVRIHLQMLCRIVARVCVEHYVRTAGGNDYGGAATGTIGLIPRRSDASFIVEPACDMDGHVRRAPPAHAPDHH